ncbi:DUF6296 family protein [Kitasatospora sp. NPDC059571]|uniref:DUF6296 family protein n=1 Tax=Kitasatospora sp. NPDC059571 TaxID=3346871 RepID=UPI0036810FCE
MDTDQRWVLTYPGAPGAHCRQQTAVVEHRGGHGPRGHALFTDESGQIRVEITEDGLAYLIAWADLPDPQTPIHAEPLP